MILGLDCKNFIYTNNKSVSSYIRCISPLLIKKDFDFNRGRRKKGQQNWREKSEGESEREGEGERGYNIYC